jgi:two-component system, NtrC family, nitrogen regulation sensor histidine kinase GlnL
MRSRSSPSLYAVASRVFYPTYSNMTPMKELSFAVDKNLRIRSWSEDLESFTGTDASFAIGKKYFHLFPPFLIHAQDAVAETFLRQRTVSLKHHAFRCLSHHRMADIKISPIRTGDNPVRQVQIVLHPSEPCTVGRQLGDAQKFIAIGKIAATLAHGVRNPLNAIKGAVVYLRDRYAHEKTLLEFTDILEAEISRLENFITRFLSTTTFDNDITQVDVNELIRKIKVFISLQTHTREIRCEYVLEDIPPIEISAFHLEQAILNIINNSIEAMKSGGTLTIKTFLMPSTPTLVALEISDTGAGIDLPVQSADSAQQSPRQGRGFGLFIADEIIKSYSGHLKIRGEHGKGTTVTFLLPVTEQRGGDPS